MANMSLKKNEMPTQAPDVRNKNFSEVALGYTEEQAIDEAKRCLNCKTKPCVGGCPVHIHIPEFIDKSLEALGHQGARKLDGTLHLLTVRDGHDAGDDGHRDSRLADLIQKVIKEVVVEEHLGGQKGATRLDLFL